MKRLAIVIASCFAAVTAAVAQQPTVALKDIYIRDPYILADPRSGRYYMYRSTGSDDTPNPKGAVEAFTTDDLENWSGPVRVFDVPDDNWITGRVWAPEVHYYKGKYYLFATLNSDIEWKKRDKNMPPYTLRATQIFEAKRPEGPFLPIGDKLPATPMDEMALDGTLWVEDGRPYMVYCHEWVQIGDGAMKLAELKKDLSAREGQPVTLFRASAAPWSTGSGEGDKKTYVTDGCFLYRTSTGKLLMLWSSFMNGEYAIGIAESTTGRITGPWRHRPEPLFSRNGGHGMVFRGFDGVLRLVIHAPNSPSGAERARIFELEDTGDTLELKKR